MARRTMREPAIDTALAFCYARLDRLSELEEFLRGTNVATIAANPRIRTEAAARPRNPSLVLASDPPRQYVPLTTTAIRARSAHSASRR